MLGLREKKIWLFFGVVLLGVFNLFPRRPWNEGPLYFNQPAANYSDPETDHFNMPSSFLDRLMASLGGDANLKPVSSKMTNLLGSSGTLFSGEVIRQFPGIDIMFSQVAYSNVTRPTTNQCSKWGVLTTIFTPPSEAIRRFSYRNDWCLVIVGDLKTNQQVQNIAAQVHYLHNGQTTHYLQYHSTIKSKICCAALCG